MNKKTSLLNSNYFLLGYLLWLFMPIIPLLCPWLVSLGLGPTFVAWLPLLLAFLVVPLLQVLIPGSMPSFPDNYILPTPWRTFLDVMLLLSFPLQLLMLTVSAEFWTTAHLDIVGSLGYLLGVGSFSSFWAINVGHELIHSHLTPCTDMKLKSGFFLLPPKLGSLLSKTIGILLLSTVFFGTFYSSHLKIHHLYVGTAKDCHTAKLGQTIYSFVFVALLSNFKRMIWLDNSATELYPMPRVNKFVLFSASTSLAFSLLFLLIFGFPGLVFFLLQSLVAIILLEWIDYLQHYGIVRIQDSNGRIEPVQEWHAWNENSWITDIYLINLFRHSDHHVNPSKPFYLLSESSLAPRYPFPYAIMMLLSLFPPIFFHLANKVLLDHPKLMK